MSKPIKRQMGSRTIPKWEVGQDAREFSDVRYETAEGMAKITINRPQVRNAFRPETLFELERAFTFARDDEKVGVIILTGQGDEAFCSGGDISVRGDDGYIRSDAVGKKGIGRLNVLDLQVQIRRTPKPVVAMVAGWVIGGGHVLHVGDIDVLALSVEALEEIRVHVYPNPASNSVAWSFPDSEPRQIRLSDAEGRVVFETVAQSSFFELDVSTFRRGSYSWTLINTLERTAASGQLILN